MANNYEKLKNKRIIEILIGNEIIEKKENYDVKMHYLSGPDLCQICNDFGLEKTYGKESRWAYLSDLLDYVIKNNRCDELLTYLFKKESFKELTSLNTPEEIEDAYTYIVKSVISKINVILLLSKTELQFIDGHFYVVETGKEPVIDIANIKLINIEYILGLKDRCVADFLSGNYDSVITKSRTLTEEVLIFILEENNIEIESKGDICKLYNQVKSLYNMRQDKSYKGSVNGLLSGLEKIIQSIAEMRNSNSDSHGVGKKRIAIREYEAKLMMNSSISFCEYILEIYRNHI